MKLTTTTTAWARLTTAARLAPLDPGDLTAPYGFAARVAALGLAQKPALRSLYELFSWRALGAAALIAIVSVATNLNSVLNSANDEALAVGDPVAEVLSLT